MNTNKFDGITKNLSGGTFISGPWALTILMFLMKYNVIANTVLTGCSWWIVLAPLWIPILFITVIGIIAVIAAALLR